MDEELDYKESWVMNNWWFWTVVLEKTLKILLDCKEIQPVHSKGNQSQIFIGRTDAEAETPILWPPDVKNWLIRRLRCWERLKAGGEGDDRGWDGWMASPTWCTNLVCFSPWCHKESHDWVTVLNWMAQYYQLEKWALKSSLHSVAGHSLVTLSEMVS